MERKNAWNTYGKREISELEELNSNYIDFLSDCKTERECVKTGGQSLFCLYE